MLHGNCPTWRTNSFQCIFALCKLLHSTLVESSQPVYCVDVHRERRYQMLCEHNFSSWRWVCLCSKHVEDNSVKNIVLMNKENCALKLVDEIIQFSANKSFYWSGSERNPHTLFLWAWFRNHLHIDQILEAMVLSKILQPIFYILIFSPQCRFNANTRISTKSMENYALQLFQNRHFFAMLNMYSMKNTS